MEAQIESVAKDIKEVNINLILLVYSKNIKVKMEILKKPGNALIEVEKKLKYI